MVIPRDYSRRKKMAREANGPTVRRVLSRADWVLHQSPHRRPSIYDVRCRTPLAVYPETGRAARNASCLTLLQARFTQPARSLGLLVVSYTTVSPLPKARGPRRSAFCCTFSRIAPGGCYPPPCSVEPGRSSVPPCGNNATVSSTRLRSQGYSTRYSKRTARFSWPSVPRTKDSLLSMTSLATRSARELSDRGIHSKLTGVPMRS
jgi:hypothetical protein